MNYTSEQSIAIRLLIASTALTVATGTVFYHYVEQFSWLDAYYFSIITLTTVGYGDLSPQTAIGKIFTTVYILTGVGIITAFITTIVKVGAKRRIEKKAKSEEA